MRVKLEDVCERGSSNIKQSDIIKMSGSIVVGSNIYKAEFTDDIYVYYGN
mgnify:CR=1 FL=1